MTKQEKEAIQRRLLGDQAYRELVEAEQSALLDEISGPYLRRLSYLDKVIQHRNRFYKFFFSTRRNKNGEFISGVLMINPGSWRGKKYVPGKTLTYRFLSGRSTSKSARARALKLAAKFDSKFNI